MRTKMQPQQSTWLDYRLIDEEEVSDERHVAEPPPRFHGYNLIETQNHTTDGHYKESISYLGAILASVAISGIFCNLFIVALVLINRKLRGSMSNVLLCHLSVVALIYSCFLLPVYLGVAFSLEWFRHPVACTILGCMNTVMTSAMLLNLTAISVDKYRTIESPLRYSTRMDRPRLTITCAVIWIPSLIFSILPAVVGPGYSYQPSQAICDVSLASSHQSMMVRWGVSLPLILVTFYIPSSIIVCCYSRIFCIARGHRKRITAMLALVMLSFQAPITRTGSRTLPPKEQKASRTIAVFLGTFFVCYIPYSLVSLIEVIFLVKLNFYVSLGINIIHQSAPFINAVVYGSMNKSLRQSLGVYGRKIYSRHFLLNRQNSRVIRASRNAGQNATNV